jgi:hypothetical protein
LPVEAFKETSRVTVFPGLEEPEERSSTTPCARQKGTKAEAANARIERPTKPASRDVLGLPKD